MDMIGKVRRMKLRVQLSDGEICRRTGLARNTVEKWLKAPGDITPKYQRKKANGKLTLFEPVLVQALCTDAHRAKHARRNGKALYAQIQARDTGVATAPLPASFAHGVRKASRTPPRPLYL